MSCVRPPVERLPHGRLRHAVEVDVVLADELVDAGVVCAPPVAPVRGGVAALRREAQHRLREADRRPQALGPAPDREAARALELGRGHAPVDVAGDAERQQALAGAEAHTPRRRASREPRRAHLPAGEGEREGLLALGGLRERVGGELGGDGVIGLAELGLDVDDRVDEALAHGLGDDGTDLRVHVPLVHEALELVTEGRQVKVPVVNRSQLGRGAADLRDGGQSAPPGQTGGRGRTRRHRPSRTCRPRTGQRPWTWRPLRKVPASTS